VVVSKGTITLVRAMIVSILTTVTMTDYLDVVDHLV